MSCLLEMGEKDSSVSDSESNGVDNRLSYGKLDQHKITGNKKEEQETRPIACQIYPGLSARKLYKFLKYKSASKPCMDYYLARLQNISPNHIQEYLERNGRPYNDMSTINSQSVDVSNNAIYMSAEWMSIISHNSSATVEMHDKSFYQIYFGSQEPLTI